MYFCPKCDYSFDICKSNGLENQEEKQPIKKINDIFYLLENNKNLNNYKVEFNKDELEKNSKFKKLNEEDKNKILTLFQSSLITGAQFKCNNCNFSKEITESVLLYQLDITEKTNKIRSLEENRLVTNNPILPRTHDYICKNIDCSTNNKKNDNKEAVFFREKNSYKINYICCKCYYSW